MPTLEGSWEPSPGSWNGGGLFELCRKHLQVEQQVSGRQIPKGGRRRSQSKVLLTWTSREKRDLALETQPLFGTGEAAQDLTVRGERSCP